MKVLRIILAILLAGASISVFSQNQLGYVKTLGRPNQKGQPLSGVSIRAKGEHNVVLSKNDGTFSMKMTGKKNGDQYSFQQIQKMGYELSDAGMIGRSYAFSAKVPITIVMIGRQQLQEDKLRIENCAYEKAGKNYRAKLAILEQQKKDKMITAEKYRQQLMELQNSFGKYEALISSLADHYARTDYDGLDEKERIINLCIEQGELERADSLLQRIGIQERIENISKRLSAGQSLIEEAQSDQAKILKQQQKDAQYLYNLYSIALSRFDNNKARFYIETRAELDTTNVDWQLDASQYVSEFMADYTKAMALAYRGLRNARSNYGEDSEQALKSYNQICEVFFKMNNFDEALVYNQKALTIAEAIYDGPHTLKAQSYSIAASLYGGLGDFSKAFEAAKQSMKIREAVDSNPNIELAESYFSYGYLYVVTGRLKEGLENMKKSVDMLIDLYGEQFNHVADGYQNFSNIYMTIGDYSKAEDYLTRAYELKKRLLGENHPDITVCYNGFCALSQAKGDYHKMLEYAQKALDIRLLIYGENNTATAKSYNNVAAAYGSLGDLEKSLEYSLRALNINKKILNQNHPDIAYNFIGIATTYFNLKDYLHARENVNHAIEIFQKAYKGENHRDVAHCYNTLGAISSGEKKYDESLKYYQKALSILKVAVGEGHDAYADCYKNIGVAYYEMGDYPQALSYLKKALDIYIKLGGEDHSLAVSTKKELQTVYEKLLDLYPEDASIQEEYQQFKNTHMQTKK